MVVVGWEMAWQANGGLMKRMRISRDLSSNVRHFTRLEAIIDGASDGTSDISLILTHTSSHASGRDRRIEVLTNLRIH